ncbi:transmembrane protein 256 homolog [Oppia nitens]|uniref:transmembrane protein 256 homolog n=1 Tax=Oppia nitens TaxID=1686743 RepID=UPI0023DC5231|nr:transmembrane protein 256 homolog [Oppia nitens]
MDNQILYPSIGSIWVQLAGIYGSLAVAMGAYGAHKVQHNNQLSDHSKVVYERANKYHLIHSLVLLAIPLVGHPWLSGLLITVGMTLFSGTCYINVFTGNKQITRLTPVGGVTLIIGWLTMAY